MTKRQLVIFEYVDEDWKCKEQIEEEHDEYVSRIESIDPQDDENYIWDSWYARGQEVAIRELLYKYPFL